MLERQIGKERIQSSTELSLAKSMLSGKTTSFVYSIYVDEE
jgi:hypothetical protein